MAVSVRSGFAASSRERRVVGTSAVGRLRGLASKHGPIGRGGRRGPGLPAEGGVGTEYGK